MSKTKNMKEDTITITIPDDWTDKQKDQLFEEIKELLEEHGVHDE